MKQKKICKSQAPEGEDRKVDDVNCDIEIEENQGAKVDNDSEAEVETAVVKEVDIEEDENDSDTISKKEDLNEFGLIEEIYKNEDGPDPVQGDICDDEGSLGQEVNTHSLETV